MVKKRLVVAIPASVISDIPHLREKTAKIGYIGRAAAIFKVDEIIVYQDDPKISQHKDLDLIATWLTYMETPQYLRKRLFEIKPALQYAGILPPLRTPHHPLKGRLRDLKVGEYREGVIVSKARDGMLVDIGVESPVLLPATQVALNKRLTFKIVKVGEKTEMQVANRSDVPDYWGFTVTVENTSLKRVIEDPRFELIIGTSKFATSVQEAAKNLSEKWARANTILLLFGAPTRGLFEIAKDQHINLHKVVDFVLNTLPNQGTETVRTEEAFLATLAIFNVQFGF